MSARRTTSRFPKGGLRAHDLEPLLRELIYKWANLEGFPLLPHQVPRLSEAIAEAILAHYALPRADPFD